MNTSYATAGDPAGRHAIHPTIRRYRGERKGKPDGWRSPSRNASTRKPRQPGATEGRRTLDPVHAGGVRNHRGRRMALR